MSNRVPTNILTGFLGVGKTTTILNLLKNKPEKENWAVLVNEFGEIGIDGALMTDQGALIKEVPGGCMCCTAGVPMSVGITALLRQKPDRLLIEPTETESKETLDLFVEAMAEILQQAEDDIDVLKKAPYPTPVRRLDEVKAVKEPNVVWDMNG